MKILILIAVLMTACSTMPTPQELEGLDFGLYPENYRDIIDASLERKLIDYNSAILRDINKPEKMGVSRVTIAGKDLNFGYGVCLKINTKNRMGGYGGFKKHLFLIRHNILVGHYYQSGRYPDTVKGDIANEHC